MVTKITEEEKYMYRCIQLAKNGANHVSPNPMVGAVIVHNQRIIGEGYHTQYGSPHAEVNAIRSVKSPSLLNNSTLYISLEPCSHYGKTPPCADLIIEKKIPKVIIGCQDPFCKVSGKGIEKLRKASVEVKTGILEKECKELIKRFLLFHTLRRPYIILKWAESADGYIDLKRTAGRPIILSTPLTTLLVHKKRAEVDAIMIGTHTAFLDNPSLTVRAWKGNHPLRFVLDKKSILPLTLHLFDGSVPTFLFIHKDKFTDTNKLIDKNDLIKKKYDNKDYSHSKRETDKLDDNEEKNRLIEYIPIDFNNNILPQITEILYQKGIQTLLVEGGATLLQSFIDLNLWDEIYIEKAKIELGSGIKAPSLKATGSPIIEKHFGTEIFHYFPLLNA